jgi:hypothetical protein
MEGVRPDETAARPAVRTGPARTAPARSGPAERSA